MKKPNRNLVEEAMYLAIEEAYKANTPFGAALIDSDGNILEKAVNTSKKDGPLAHAEMNLLNASIKKGIYLKDSFLVSTCEPCPMCMAASIWSKVKAVYFGLGIVELKHVFGQIDVAADYIA